jgi:hypothetical protein
MAHAAGDAHPFPIYGAHYRVTFPIFASDGTLKTGAGSPDSERSIDGATFADCTNEATELATSSGMYYLDLTGAEMTAKCTAAIVKSSDGLTTPIVLYPARLPSILTGTAAGGGASTITLAASSFTEDQALNGCYVLITNNSPAGSQYQARKIISCVASTQVCTVESAWGTNPDNTSTYSILVPSAVNVASMLGVAAESDPVDSPNYTLTGTPTTTEFKCAIGDRSTDANAEKGKVARITAGSSKYQQALITASSHSGGELTLTLTASEIKTAPSAGDTFAIIGRGGTAA